MSRFEEFIESLSIKAFYTKMKKERQLAKKKRQKEKIAKLKELGKQIENERWEREYEGIFLTRKQIKKLEAKKELPVLDTPVFLNYGEFAVYYCEATRLEIRNLAKGAVSTKYLGEMVLTNKRIVFLSNQKGFEIPYKSITTITEHFNRLSFQNKSRSYTLLITKAKLALIAFNGVRTGNIPIAKDTNNFKTGIYDEGKYNKVNISEEETKFIINSVCIDEMEGHEFEHFCAELLRKNGFINVEVTPGSGDQGVDVLAEKGGVKYAVQCKNYASPLGNTPVQEVNTGKTFYHCHVGVVLTNSTFTPKAIELATATGVLLWDRSVLQSMMKQE